MRIQFTTVCVTAALTLTASPGSSEHEWLETRAFSVAHEITLPGTPCEIYNAVTGDVSGWWDHSFSKSPAKLYIEARPGGGFWEIFDDDGSGVRHAVVTAAQPCTLLRFEGPLGLAGNPIQMVHTYTLSPADDGHTRLSLSVFGWGSIDGSWAEAVDDVWTHFLFEQLAPYVESGKHLESAE